MYIYGASGHGSVILSILKSLGIKPNGFLDDGPKGSDLNGLKVFAKQEISLGQDTKMIIGIGDNYTRMKLVEELKEMHYLSVVHPMAVIDSSVTINEGTVIMASVVVNTNVSIGKHSIVNTAAVIEHDCFIGDFVHVSPNATLTGGVVVGEGSHIGAGAVVLPNVIIGKWTVVGAGAVVTKDIPDNVVVIGNPARVLRFNYPDTK